MENLNTQEILDNILSNLWKSDKEKLEQDWKPLKEYNSNK